LIKKQMENRWSDVRGSEKCLGKDALELYVTKYVSPCCLSRAFMWRMEELWLGCDSWWNDQPTSTTLSKVNKPFKEYLRREYKVWLLTENPLLTPSGKIMREPASNLQNRSQPLGRS
jgi:hypothetical protein